MVRRSSPISRWWRNDKGSEEIISVIKKFEKAEKFRVFRNIPHLEYLSMIKYCDVLIGNSSSGIIEASSLGTFVINVGSRNVGREHAKNVIFVNSKDICFQ